MIPHGLRPDSYGVFVAKGFAVVYYSVTLGRLGLTAS